MKFTPLPLVGAYIIELDRHEDERGYFARTFCSQEFKVHRLVTNFIQMSTSFNKDMIRIFIENIIKQKINQNFNYSILLV